MILMMMMRHTSWLLPSHSWTHSRNRHRTWEMRCHSRTPLHPMSCLVYNLLTNHATNAVIRCESRRKQLQRMRTNQLHSPPSTLNFCLPHSKTFNNKLSTGFTTGQQTLQLTLDEPTKISGTHKSLYRWVTAIDRNEECEQSIGGAHGRLKLRIPLNASLTVFPPNQKPQRSPGSRSPTTENAFLVSEFLIGHRYPHRTVVIQSHEMAGTCWERVPIYGSAPQRSLPVPFSCPVFASTFPVHESRFSVSTSDGSDFVFGELVGSLIGTRNLGRRTGCAGISRSDGEDSARGMAGMKEWWLSPNKLFLKIALGILRDFGGSF